MPRIMCTPPLYKRFAARAHASTGKTAPLLHGVALGDWAAKSFANDGRELVLAVEQRTWLALVFSLPSAREFRQCFADALRAMLEDLVIAPRQVALETDAIAFAPLARLADTTLRGALADLQYFCELELASHSDLRIVQFNLNDFPHGPRTPGVSKDAVRALFEAADWSESLPH